jgi:hypothetical protein
VTPARGLPGSWRVTTGFENAAAAAAADALNAGGGLLQPPAAPPSPPPLYTQPRSHTFFQTNLDARHAVDVYDATGLEGTRPVRVVLFQFVCDFFHLRLAAISTFINIRGGAFSTLFCSF